LRKCFAQDKKLTYTQFEVTLAFTGNPKSGEVDQRTNIKNLGSFQTVWNKISYGLRYKKNGIYSGLNWDWSNKLVVAYFANFRLSPKM
jgi:hypothetical protein